MDVCRWYAISGDSPDLGLPATAPGTRYLVDNDPARDVVDLAILIRHVDSPVYAMRLN